MNIALIDDEAAILGNVRKCVENEIVPQDEASLFTERPLSPQQSWGEQSE